MNSDAIQGKKREPGEAASKTRIVILAGGFAGVALAQRLERLTNEYVEVVLISSENHLVFSPLLAEAVGREITPLHVVVPGRQLVRRSLWLTARATTIERNARKVHYVSSRGERGVLSYDHLVIACGSVVDLSLIPGLSANSFPLKTLGDAVFLTNSLIEKLEEAAMKSNFVEKRRLLTVVVVGGGFSGVEVAGAINDLMKRARQPWKSTVVRSCSRMVSRSRRKLWFARHLRARPEDSQVGNQTQAGESGKSRSCSRLRNTESARCVVPTRNFLSHPSSRSIAARIRTRIPVSPSSSLCTW